MRQNRILDQKSATEIAWALWRRKDFAAAQETWADWLGASQAGYLHPQRIAYGHFEDVPSRSPFDWALTQAAGVEIQRDDGLDIRFSGTANVDFSNVRQFTTVDAGRYLFSAEVRATDITTDQAPFFHIFDPTGAGRVNVESLQIKGTTARSWITVDVRVPSGTHALQIQLERRPSQKFDNKIGGSLHVYHVSLLPVV